MYVIKYVMLLFQELQYSVSEDGLKSQCYFKLVIKCCMGYNAALFRWAFRSIPRGPDSTMLSTLGLAELLLSLGWLLKVHSPIHCNYRVTLQANYVEEPSMQ